MLLLTVRRLFFYFNNIELNSVLLNCISAKVTFLFVKQKQLQDKRNVQFK